ncbi:MAG: type I restriction enzyme HsdR N-terminal domain-containing protein [Simkaniaceae bacterium]
MGSLLQRKALFPEERVRQKLLREMINEKGYCSSHILVERGLNQLPHLAMRASLPDRRFDLLAYENKSLNPLLLVECKACKLSERVLEQVLGYNHFVGAPFFALSNSKQVITFWQEKGELKYLQKLPSYDELITLKNSISKKTHFSC